MFSKKIRKDTIEAFNFIRKNDHFFAAAFLDPSFQNWASKKENEVAIKKLTEEIYQSFNIGYQDIAEFKVACVGKISDQNNRNYNPDFVPTRSMNKQLLAILQENSLLKETLVEFSRDKKFNQLIDKWYSINPFPRVDEAFTTFQKDQPSSKPQVNPAINQINEKLNQFSECKDILEAKQKEFQNDFFQRESYLNAARTLSEIVNAMERQEAILFRKVNSTVDTITIKDLQSYESEMFKKVRACIPIVKEHRGLLQDFVDLCAIILGCISCGANLLIPSDKFKVETQTWKDLSPVLQALKIDTEETTKSAMLGNN